MALPFSRRLASSLRKQMQAHSRKAWSRKLTAGTREPQNTFPSTGESLHLDNWLPRDVPDGSCNNQTSRLLRKVQKLMREGVYARKPELPSAVIKELQRQYLMLDAEGRERALTSLGSEFGPDLERVRHLTRHAVDLLNSERNRGIGWDGHDVKEGSSFEGEGEREVSASASGSESQLGSQQRVLRDLHVALTPLRAHLFEHINAHPGGLKFLVDLRADLLHLLRKQNRAGLRALDGTLRHMLKAWLGPACLELRHITWDDPASLLEKIVTYEAVHPMASILDLKPRLGVGRRCFAYFHPAMPGEPLIFIEVALTSGLTSSIKEVLHTQASSDEKSATTALFYSISSTQAGLAGIDLGHSLIQKVVRELRSSLPNIQEFATLSPIPGFLPWLRSKLAMTQSGPTTFAERDLLLPDEAQALLKTNAAAVRQISGGNGALEVLRSALDRQGGVADLDSDALRRPLLRLCARYLVHERKRGRALDPVANFHIRNGAVVERLNWMADKSSRALHQSAGIMVNYMYRLEEMDENSRSYIGRAKIPFSNAVKALL